MSPALVHRSVEQPVREHELRLMALPLPDHLTVDLEGLVPVLEYYEYVAERVLRDAASEARRRAWQGDVEWPALPWDED